MIWSRTCRSVRQVSFSMFSYLLLAGTVQAFHLGPHSPGLRVVSPSFLQSAPNLKNGRCLQDTRIVSITGSAATASGIVSVETCAQYVKDQSSLGIQGGQFISWSVTTSTCEGYVKCTCVTSGACTGEEGWSSVLISDVIGDIAPKTIRKL